MSDGATARSRSLLLRRRIALTVILAAQAVILATSVPRNSVTIDEFMHLPVAISYWEYGQFWPYHHNPPLIRLLFATPAVVADIPVDYSVYYPLLHSRMTDINLGRDFMWLNRDRYLSIFANCRFVVVALTVLGGYAVFCWSRELFGEVAAFVSLCLWTFCPNVLAHGALVTPDVGATVVGFLATWQFWRYLRRPSLMGACLSGILLGLAQASKFSLMILPVVWIALAAAALWGQRRAQRADSHWPARTKQNTPAAHAADHTPAYSGLTAKRAVGHAILVLILSVLTLNGIYRFEGTGKPLASFQFRSKLLTTESHAAEEATGGRRNRFRGTPVAGFPVPLPEHYVLGFDDQMFDIDSGMFCKYLRGELRRREESGWWYYYLYGMLVKVPLGTLMLVAAAVALLCVHRRFRSDLVSELALSLPVVATVVLTSSHTGLNSHVRYMLPISPFVFVFVGRVALLLRVGRTRVALVLGLLLVGNVASVLRSHPHYLTYFNEAAGGPRRGLEHLADSNLDWGQGLVALREWLETNAPRQRIRLAYFGFVDPEIFGIEYEFPSLKGPTPGLQAVSANYLAGIPWMAPDGNRGQLSVGENELAYFRHFEPIATPGFSIYVYDLTVEDVNRVRAELGIEPWSP